MAFRYLAKRYAAAFFLVTLAMCFLIFIVSYGSFVKRFIDKTTFFELLLMSLAGLPEFIHNFLDLIIGIAAVITIYRLNRSNELLILRAQGRSGLWLVMPFMAVAGLIGVFDALALSPLSRWTNDYVFDVKHKLKSETIVSNVYGTRAVEPVTLHQHDGEGNYFIQAKRDKLANERLYDANVFRLNDKFELREWYKAPTARLSGAEMRLYNAEALHTGAHQASGDVVLPAQIITNTVSNFDGIAPTQDFWPLLSLWLEVDTMQQKNWMAFQTFFAKPFLLMGIVLLAAVFLLPFRRHGGQALKMSASLTLIFLLSLLLKLLLGFAEIGFVSLFMALWMPAVMLIGFNLSFIANEEER